MAASKRCEICETRPIMTGAEKAQVGSNFPYCFPCMTKADWENTHSDRGHEDIDTYSVANTTFAKKSEVDAYVAETKEEMKGCWICHPEMDETQESYVQRNGTSREGMTIIAKGSAKEKAALVAMAIEGTGKGTVKVSTRSGFTTLKGSFGETKIVAIWEGQRFHRAEVGSRKARNVSEILRLIKQG